MSRACTGFAEKASDTNWGEAELAVLRRGPPQCAGAGRFDVHVRNWERERAGTVEKEEVDTSRRDWAYRPNVLLSTRRCNGRVVPHLPITQCQHARTTTIGQTLVLFNRTEHGTERPLNPSIPAGSHRIEQASTL